MKVLVKSNNMNPVGLIREEESTRKNSNQQRITLFTVNLSGKSENSGTS